VRKTWQACEGLWKYEPIALVARVVQSSAQRTLRGPKHTDRQSDQFRLTWSGVF